MVIGISLIDGGGVCVAVIAAVFLSNLPESIAATTGLERTGMSRAALFRMWTVIALAVAVSSMIGFGVLDDASHETIALVEGFAAGALLVMLADTMMLEAYERAHKAAGPIHGAWLRARLRPVHAELMRRRARSRHPIGVMRARARPPKIGPDGGEHISRERALSDGV